jgi:hypothetical protein
MCHFKLNEYSANVRFFQGHISLTQKGVSEPSNVEPALERTRNQLELQIARRCHQQLVHPLVTAHARNSEAMNEGDLRY